jgi:hypothetical protein
MGENMVNLEKIHNLVFALTYYQRTIDRLTAEEYAFLEKEKQIQFGNIREILVKLRQLVREKEQDHVNV